VTHLLALMVLLLCSSLGCSPDADSSPPCDRETDPEACWTEYYFRRYEPDPVSPCSASAVPDTPGGAVEIQLFRGAGIEDRSVAEQAGRLARFFEPYGLSFWTRTASADAGLAYAMNGSAPELDAALDAANIPIEPLTEEEELRAKHAIGAVIFARLKDFVVRTSIAMPNAVNLLVVEQVVEPQLAEVLYGSPRAPVTGLGLSPERLARVEAGSPSDTLHEMIGLDEEFTPTLVLGLDNLDAFGAGADNVVAHEMGHALGLEHADEAGNVMSPTVETECRAWLSPEQTNDFSVRPQ
jgi:hypothetical protein